VPWTDYFRWEWLFFDGTILAFCAWQLISLRRLKRQREAKSAVEEQDEKQ
jgi:hypothetical protein